MLLAGDIGGTKTVLGLFEATRGPRHPVAREVYSSRDHPDLDSLVVRFLRAHSGRPTAACFGVAGPVTDGRAAVTNLPWNVEADGLSELLGSDRVWLINDLQAVAESLADLQASDLKTLHNGEPRPFGNRAVIAPGTGLGEAFATWDGSRYVSHPSEGGHADFAPANDLQAQLLAYLRRTFDHVSYERVCAGVGIPNIYRFFRDGGHYVEPAGLRMELEQTRDMVPVLFRYALEEDDPPAICTATLEMFVSILGAECGNLALKIRPTGGLYLAGGLTLRVVAHLNTDLFKKPLFNKGSMTGLVRSIPVRVITNPDAALMGAAAHGLRRMGPHGDGKDRPGPAGG